MTQLNDKPEVEKKDSSSGKEKIIPFDLLLFTVIFIFFIIGILISKSTDGNNNYKFAPLGPSLLFGSAVSLLVYHFLGGIEKNDASIEGSIFKDTNVKLCGSIGALVIVSGGCNWILEKQMNRISVKINYDKSDLVVLKKSANAVDLEIFAQLGVTNEKVEEIKSSQDKLENLVTNCLSLQGVCESPPLDVVFTISEKNLEKGEVKVCGKNLKNRNLILQGRDEEKIAAVHSRLDTSCNSKSSNLVKISKADAKDLKVKKGDKGKASLQPSLEP